MYDGRTQSTSRRLIQSLATNTKIRQTYDKRKVQFKWRNCVVQKMNLGA